MQLKTLRAVAIGAVLLSAMAATALADSKDYEFQLVDKEVKQGEAPSRSSSSTSLPAGFRMR